MKLGRLVAAAVTVLSLCGSSYAGNGSNFWHYQNGLDYYFFYAFPPAVGSAAWRCFPGTINHAPTKVVNALDTNTVGTYASKIETLWMNVIGNGNGFGGGFGGQPLAFPYILVSSNNGTCSITQLIGTALFGNWGLTSAGRLVGPLNGTNLQLNALAVGVNIPGSWPRPIINTIRLDVVGAISAITIPEGSATALVTADRWDQGPRNGQYWTGSVDDRRVCSAQPNGGLFNGFFIFQPFIFTGGSPPFLAVEWGNAVSTIDASVELGINAVGLGPSGLNPGPLYAAPYDAGQNGVISITGSTLNAPTAGEIFGIQCYDDNNPFGGSNHLSLLNFSGLRTGYPAPLPMCPTSGGLMGDPAQDVPSGGAGGPALSLAIPQHPRSTGKFDFVTNNLLANPLWTASTIHAVAPFGIFFPFYGAAVKCGGSTGNNGGFQILIPPLPALVGVEVALWQLNMNAAGTAVAKTANKGHSHTNITPIGLAP
jgi:hypothetical protein